MSLPVTAESRSAEPDHGTEPERRMDRRRLKNYAPKARAAFMAGVKARAAKLGIHGQDRIDAIKEEGDIAIIGGHPYPRKLADQRRKLIERIQARGFDQVIEEIAYTWFNRFAAIRYMEIHGYLSHGLRVLSHPRGEREPEILQQAQHITLPGLNKETILNLKLDNKDEELYRRLIIGQCNALHEALPFLFEKIDDETELLLPDNLLHTESLIRQLVDSVPEEDWQETEVIGWLYQFYISEKKDKLMAAKKAYKSEDIPAVTQLFTPNWIVQYMVQNSLGHLWMATYPASGLKARMPYYIEPAEQTEEVKAQLTAITPKSLNPEELTLLDPACGSGHILLEGYNLLKNIYLERGYPLKDIPRLILEKNLYGIDIDDRAAQLAGFALLMRARADDRHIIDNPPRLNIIAIQDSKGLNAKEIAQALLPQGRFELVPGDDLLPETLPQAGLSAPVKSEVQEGTIENLIDLFADAKTFGSLITVPDNIAQALPALKNLIAQNPGTDLFKRKAMDALAPLVRQADFLAHKYDAVVANPPYMGSRGMNTTLKDFIKKFFPDSKADLFAVFTERTFPLVKKTGYNALVTMQSWMFLSSYERLRQKLLSQRTIETMTHMGNMVMGIAFGTAATVWRDSLIKSYRGSFSFVDYESLNGNGVPEEFPVRNDRLIFTSSEKFSKIPSSPIVYWSSDALIQSFEETPLLYETTISDGQNITANNEQFLRLFWELNCKTIGTDSRWVFYSKGGSYRKWFGNLETVVDWSPSARSEYRRHPSARILPEYLWFKEGICWTLITSSFQSFRLLPKDATFDKTGSSIFCKKEEYIDPTLCFLNSQLSSYILKIYNSTISLQVDDVRRLPFDPQKWTENHKLNPSSNLILMAERDWNSFETSWNFIGLPCLSPELKDNNIEKSYLSWRAKNILDVNAMKKQEEENNRVFIEAYKLQNEVSYDVPIEQVTLTVNPSYRYGPGLSDKEYEERFLADSMKELISYAIGCIMGRYSLDAPGLIYAHERNKDFDFSQYKTFPADDDGIIPVTEIDWFEDDAANRFADFLIAVWGKETLEQNLRFVAEALESRRDENAMETIRRYIGSSFFKDHLKTYKSRPIYWLFSSGKEKAFECLVYLHRYNEGTLAKIRMDYVVPMLNRFHARIDALNLEAQNASSATVRRRAEKEREKLQRQKVELQGFDDKLRHYADQRIAIDLDDGVKVNYGKFGDLLAEVKKVTGQKDDD